MRDERWADVQSDVKSPQQSEQLHHQVDDEPAVVPLSHAVLDPGTVVVEAAHAAIARLAVLRSHWLLLE